MDALQPLASGLDAGDDVLVRLSEGAHGAFIERHNKLMKLSARQCGHFMMIDAIVDLSSGYYGLEEAYG